MVHRGRRFGHEVDRGGGFREGNYFAQRLFAGEKHGDAVDAQGDAAVGRRAIGQRVQEKSEAAAELLFAKAERAEQALLNVLAVDTDAAGAELVSIEDKIVALRSHFPWRGLELFQIFVDDAGERMLGADPGLVLLAPFKQWKSRDPEKFPLCAVDQVERFAELQTHLPGDER